MFDDDDVGERYGLRFYDRAGRRIGLWQYARYKADIDYRVVAQHDIDDCWLSTVWLGDDYGLGGPPLIFETVLFDPDGEPVFEHRYSSETAALAGHDQLLAAVREHGIARLNQ